MRLKDKVAVVVGGGQTKGDTIGNGRATAIRFAAEGAVVMASDEASYFTGVLLAVDGGLSARVG